MNDSTIDKPYFSNQETVHIMHCSTIRELIHKLQEIPHASVWDLITKLYKSSAPEYDESKKSYSTGCLINTDNHNIYTNKKIEVELDITTVQ